MIEVATAGNMVEAMLMADELKSHGIKVFVSGGYLSGAIGELPADSVLRLYINSEAHVDRAKAILTAFDEAKQVQLPKRWCSHCEEWLEGQFEHCWQCGNAMPDPLKPNS